MNADVNMEYCMESKNDGRKIYQEKGNGEQFSSGETDGKKKRYNRVCLATLALGIAAVLLWGVFSATSDPGENAVGAYSEAEISGTDTGI